MQFQNSQIANKLHIPKTELASFLHQFCSKENSCHSGRQMAKKI